MIYKYIEYIKETINNRPTILYYDNDDFKVVLDNNWDKFFIENIDKKKKLYLIKMLINNNYYGVIIQNLGEEDLFFIEKPEKFKNKFISEFNKKPNNYKNFEYYPKIIPDIEKYKKIDEFNL